MKTRNTALDLYRILCMFLITTIHIINYSELMGKLSDHHVNFWLANGIQVLQVFSISGFTLISSYYLVDRPFKMGRMIRFALSVVFFSVVIWLLSLVLVRGDFSVMLAAKSVFPLMTYHYWYPVSYLFLLGLSPFLNRAIVALTRKELLAGLGVLALISTVYYHLNPFTEAAVFLGHHTHNLLWFILMYGVAGYLKRYGVKHPKIMGVGLFCLSGCLLYALYALKNNAFGLTDTYPVLLKLMEKVDLLSYNSILSLLFTVSSFVMFTQFRVTPPKWIGKVLTFTVPAVFVIYLFQEHSGIREALWELVDITAWADSYLLIPVMIGCFVGLFVISVLIHLLYRLCDKWFLGRIEAFIEKCLQGIVNRFFK